MRRPSDLPEVEGKTEIPPEAAADILGNAEIQKMLVEKALRFCSFSSGVENGLLKSIGGTPENSSLAQNGEDIILDITIPVNDALIVGVTNALACLEANEASRVRGYDTCTWTRNNKGFHVRFTLKAAKLKDFIAGKTLLDDVSDRDLPGNTTSHAVGAVLG